MRAFSRCPFKTKVTWFAICAGVRLGIGGCIRFARPSARCQASGETCGKKRWDPRLIRVSGESPDVGTRSDFTPRSWSDSSAHSLLTGLGLPVGPRRRSLVLTRVEEVHDDCASDAE